MKTCLLLLACFTLSTVGRAQSTINATNRYAWAANLGWTDWRASAADGVVVGEYVCAGFVYGANIGWINLGSGLPANGIRYTNTSAGDFGVNVMGDGTLRGYAYGANIGWINFESLGNPRVNFVTGALAGFAWGANIGWINLGDLAWHPVTDTLAPAPDTDGDGLADAWELEHAGKLTVLSATGDADGDGVSDLDEYLADTDPFDGDARLRITDLAAMNTTTTFTLTWTSRLSRSYHIESSTDLLDGKWTESLLGTIPPDSNVTTKRGFNAPFAMQRFFRVRAARPLVP